MTLLPEVRQELYATAARRAAVAGAASDRGGRGWLRAGVRTVPVAVAVAVAVVVLVVALLALRPGHGHSSPQQPAVASGPPPPIPGPPPPGSQPYLETANKALKAEDPACGQAGASITPRTDALLTGSPPQAMLAAFSILARPATKADQRMIALIKRHRRERGGGFGDVYLNDIRQAQYRYGGGYFLFPVAVANAARTPVRCDREELAAVRHAAAHAPAAIRSRLTRHTAAVIASQRYDQEHPDGICLEHLNNRGFGGGGCGLTTYDLAQGVGGGITSGEGARGGGWIQAGIIPDGVATVAVRYPVRRRRGQRPTRVFSATVPVVNNVVVVKVPPGVDMSHRTVVWRSVTGVVVPHAP